jgi:hypothetical protein
MSSEQGCRKVLAQSRHSSYAGFENVPANPKNHPGLLPVVMTGAPMPKN